LTSISAGINVANDRGLPDRMVEWLTDDALAIFLFHGVIKQQTHQVRNYTGKHIPAGLFSTCIRRVKESGYPLTMDDVLEYCENAEPFPPRSFAITFDDGFENNVSVALPIMDDLQIPAMIYITTGFVDENRMSWIDRIEYAVEAVASHELKVDWSPKTFQLSDYESRIQFLSAVRAYVKNDSDCNVDEYADKLCAQLGFPDIASSEDPIDLKLTWRQVRQVDESELFSIGGHSHTHSILSYLDEQQLAFELDKSFELLKNKAGVRSDHYSYPEGLSHCYSSYVISELKKRGVRCCPTAIEGVNRIGADSFQLNRIMVA